MQTSPCPTCGTASPLAYQAADYNKKISDVVFDYYRCPRDRLLFMDPIPADLGRYYPNSYYDLPQTQNELVRVAEKFQQWKLDVVLEHKMSGNLLEIGPAYGLFAFLAKRAGFKVTGVEMDARCCTYLRDEIGIDVVETSDTLGALDALPPFDVIVMWQVIEHLPDPWTTLAHAAKRLAPGGILVLDTPNPDAFQFSILGHRWAHLDAPRHLMLIPSELLVEQADAQGLSVEMLSATRAAGFNGFGWGHTLLNWLGDNPAGRASLVAGKALGKLLGPIERTGWRGATYTAVFRKGG